MSPLKLRIQFWQLRYLFLRELVKNIAQCPKRKKNRKQNRSPLKCYLGHVECNSNLPVEKLEKKPKTSCSMSENDEKFRLFSKRDFFQNDFIDTKNAVLTGRPNFSCPITGNDLKKNPQNCKNFKKSFFKMFSRRGRKQLESRADLFRTASQKFSARCSKK